MISGVVLKDLEMHKDERGALFEILRADYPEFKGFGQAYMTICKPGWVKGWHYHLQQQDYFCVLRGKAKVVLYDQRNDSVTHGEINEFPFDADKPQVLVIPVGVVHGFEAILGETAWILNLPDHLYNYCQPDEHRIPLHSPDIPYEPWKHKQGW